jgi:hypothetical protein
MNIDVAPVVAHQPFQLDTTTYFSELAAQEALLHPFRREIRGMPRVTINGTVANALARSAVTDFSRDKFDDSGALIESWTAGKAKGTQLILQGDYGARSTGLGSETKSTKPIKATPGPASSN